VTPHRVSWPTESDPRSRSCPRLQNARTDSNSADLAPQGVGMETGTQMDGKRVKIGRRGWGLSTLDWLVKSGLNGSDLAA